MSAQLCAREKLALRFALASQRPQGLLVAGVAVMCALLSLAPPAAAQTQAPEASEPPAAPAKQANSPALLKTIEELRATLDRSNANGQDITNRLIQNDGKNPSTKPLDLGRPQSLPGGSQFTPAKPQAAKPYVPKGIAPVSAPVTAADSAPASARTPFQGQLTQTQVVMTSQAVTELQSSLQKAEQEKRALAEKLRSLQEKHLQIAQQLHLLREQRRRDEVAVQSEKAQDKATESRQLEELRSEAAKAETAKQEATSAIDLLEKEKAALQQRLSETEKLAQTTAANAQSYKAEAAKIFEIMRAGLADRDNQNKALARQVQELKTQGSSQALTAGAHDTEKASLSKALETAQQEIASLQTNNRSLLDRLAQVQKSTASAPTSTQAQLELSKQLSEVQAMALQSDSQRQALCVELAQLKNKSKSQLSAVEAEKAKVTQLLQTAQAQVAELAAAKLALTNEIAQIKQAKATEVSQAKQALAAQLVQSQRLTQEQQTAADAQLNKLQQVKAQLEAQLHQTQADNSQLRARLQAVQTGNDNDKTQLMRGLSEAQSTITKLMSEKHTLIRQLSETERAHQADLSQVATSKSQLAGQVASAQSTITRLQSTREDLEARLSQSQAQLLQLQKQAQTELANAASVKDVLTKQLQALRAQWSRLSQEKQLLAQEKQALTQEVEQLRANPAPTGWEEEKAQLTKSLGEANDRLVKLQFGEDTLAAQLQEANKQIEDQVAQISLLKADAMQHLSDAQGKHSELESKSQALAAECRELKERLAQANNAQSDQAKKQEELAAAQATIAQLTTDKHNLAAQLSKLKNQYADEAQGVSMIQQQLSREAKDAQSKTMAAEATARDAQSRVAETQAREQEAQSRAQEALAKAQEAQVRAQNARIKAQEAQAKVQELEGKAQTAEMKAQSAETKVRELEEERNALVAQLDSIKEKFAAMNHDAVDGKGLAAHKERLEKLLSESNAAVSSLASANDALTEKVKLLQRQLVDSQTLIANQKHELSSKIKEPASDEEKQALKANIDTLTKRLEKADTERQSLAGQLSQLLDQIVQMQSQHLASKTASIAERDLLIQAANDAKRALANSQSATKTAAAKEHRQQVAGGTNLTPQ